MQGKFQLGASGLTCLLACILFAPGWTGFAGEAVIEGTVTLPARRGGADTSARYGQKSGKVAEPEKPAAVVYLEGTFPSTSIPASVVTNMVQRGYQFSPSLLPVLTNTTVRFPCEDADYHHVFSYSKAREFDLGRYRQDENPPAVVFDKSGEVLIGCEIHDHMQAVVLVLETPHFVRTDSAGTYRLPLQGVPPGDYQLKAWVGPKNIRERTVTVKDGATIRADFPGQ